MLYNVKKREDGFTLIELLVVIIIIGILAAIAIPLFLDQRRLAVDASVKSDVRNTVAKITTAIAINGTTDPTTVAPQKSAGLGANENVGIFKDGTTGDYIVYGFDSDGKANVSSATAFTFKSATGQFTTSDQSAQINAASKTVTVTLTGSGASTSQDSVDNQNYFYTASLAFNGGDSSPAGAAALTLKMNSIAAGMPNYTTDCTTTAAQNRVRYVDTVTNFKAYDSSNSQIPVATGSFYRDPQIVTVGYCGAGVGGAYVGQSMNWSVAFADNNQGQYYSRIDHATFNYGGNSYTWSKFSIVKN